MSIVTTIASLTHAVMVRDRPGITEAIFGTLVPVSRLVACNFVNRRSPSELFS